MVHALIVRYAISVAVSLVGLALVLIFGVVVILSPGWNPATTSDPRLDPRAPIPEQYVALIQQAGTTCPVISAAVLAAQIEAESNWNPNARSPVGARGISQFMPGTWRQYGVDGNGDGRANVTDPADAIPSQARFMCKLAAIVGKLGGDQLSLALAAYNAGPAPVLRCKCVPQNGETNKYVDKILTRLSDFASIGPGVDPNFASGDSGAVTAAGMKWLGLPYVWGGGTLTGPSGVGRDLRGPGFDCSGLTRIAFYQASGGKLILPRVSRDQARLGVAIPANLTAMQPGDLIAMSLHGGGIDHVGIYAGNGKMLHAPRTGKNVEITNLTAGYYKSKPWTVRRLM